MDEERVSDFKKRCPAMITHGIENPENQEGISFCVEQCPYDFCVVFEKEKNPQLTMMQNKVRISIELRKHRVSIEDIALILNTSARTIHRYLKKRC